MHSNTSAQAIAGLWREYRASRTVRNRNALILAYRPLVYRAVRHWRARLGSRSIAGELASWGFEGLLQAIERCGDTGSFAAYASRRINGAILDGLRQTGVDGRRRGHARDIREQLQPGGTAFRDTGTLADQIPASGLSADARLIRAEFWRLVGTSLPHLGGLLLERIYIQGDSIREAAGRLGISYARARTIHECALGQLRRMPAVMGMLTSIAGGRLADSTKKT